MGNVNQATEILQREFLGIRARLIDIAATLDRIERAQDEPMEDPRLDKICQGIAVLGTDTPNRTEQIQLIFSLGHKE